MAIYGTKVLTDAYPCRFAYLSMQNEKGKYSVELLVPKEDADKLNDALYGDNTRIIEMNKATKSAKKPKKLYSPVYKYDLEKKETIVDDEGERVEEEDVVKFTFSSKKRPQIQFKKGLDKSAIIGSGSTIQLSCNVYAGNFVDEKGKSTDYTALSMDGVRVHELVSYAGAESAFEDDDEFNDEDDFQDEEKNEEEQEAPKGKTKGKRDF